MSTVITDDLHKAVFKPAAALIAYRNDKEDCYLETRPILKNGTMGVTKPVTRSFLNSLLSSFSVTYAQTPVGTVPRNLLYADSRPGKEKYVWWEPAQIRHQSFVKNLEMEDGDYPMPAVVYMVDRDVLSVFAIKDRKPKENTRLYRGPFFNYYEDGHICLGDSHVVMPDPLTWTSLLQCWQNLFWNSTNSHIMNYGNPIKGNLVSILKEHKTKDSFDCSLLVPIKKTLKDLLHE